MGFTKKSEASWCSALQQQLVYATKLEQSGVRVGKALQYGRRPLGDNLGHLQSVSSYRACSGSAPPTMALWA